RFEQLDEGLTRVAAAAFGFNEVLAELLFQHTVHALQLLLFAQLQAEIRSARTRGTAMLTGLGFELALGIQRTASALQKQISTLATRELALRSNITCQDASPEMRRRLGGRQPLCGTGVTSEMLVILMPRAFRERIEDSRPGPGPFTSTSSVLMPYSIAWRPACSAATCAANGADLREPLNPAPPAVAHDRVLP